MNPIRVIFEATLVGLLIGISFVDFLNVIGVLVIRDPLIPLMGLVLGLIFWARISRQVYTELNRLNAAKDRE